MRRWVVMVAAVAVGIALVVATLPWWWGAVVRGGAARVGVTVGEYERVGYGRWALREVAWSGAVEVTVARVELPHVLAWAWSGAGAGEIVAEGWRIEKAETAEKVEGESEAGWKGWWEQVAEGRALAERWLPPVRAVDGAGFGVTVDEVRWTPAEMRVVATGVRGWEREAKVELNGEDSGRWRVAAELGSGETMVAVASANGVRVEGTWWEQPWSAEGTWAAAGWGVREGRATAAGWVLPGERLGVGKVYREVRGEARATWDDGVYAVEVTAEGEPGEDAGATPALAGRMKVGGEGTRVEVRELAVNGAGLRVELAEPWALDVAAWRETGLARVWAEVDVAAMTGGEGSGTLTARLDVRRDGEEAARAEGTMEVAGWRWGDGPVVEASWAVTAGEDRLVVREGRVTAGEGSELAVSGAWRWADRVVVDGVLKGRVARGVVARWIPAAVQFETVEVTAEVGGAWPDVAHAGALTWEGLKVGAAEELAGEAEWQGVGMTQVGADVAWRSATGKGEATGTWEGGGAEVEALEITREDGETLRLVGVARWREGRLEPLELVGGETRVRVAGSATGGELGVENFSRAWVEPWFTVPGAQAWSIERLVVKAARRETNWTGQGEIAAVMALGENAVVARATGALEERELVVTAAEVSEGGRVIVSASGRVPGSMGAAWTWEEDGAVRVEVATLAHEGFWRLVDEAAGVRLEAPVVAINLGGTWARPTGEARLQVAGVELDSERWGSRWPKLRDVVAVARADGTGVEVESVRAAVAGQRLEGSGKFPWGPGSWAERRAAWGKAAWWRDNAEGRLEVPGAEVAAWASLGPGVLAPTGSLSLAVEIDPGRGVTGRLDISDAATRPLGPLGALQDVRAAVRFEGRRVVLEDVRAQTGGRGMTLTGEAAWPRGEYPRWDLRLQGRNAPLVRQTGLLVRGDLNLRVQTESNGQTWVRGTVGLRDGLFLADITSLRPSVGGRAAAPDRRPPFFSVEVEPLADWGLDVAVSGPGFMRLATPVFNGRASADFQLSGTLREPRAVGEATVHRGRIKLPFATFEVQQGAVRLLESDPFTMQLGLTGTSRRMGYELRMDLSGTATAPQLEFSSSPPLAAEEVLLMVMAGEAPQDEVRYTAAQRATRLGAYLGQNLLNEFSGQDDGRQRLNLTTGETVSRQGRETYRIEYEMSDRWGLVGEYDEFDDFNAGVKWRFVGRRRGEEAGDGR